MAWIDGIRWQGRGSCGSTGAYVDVYRHGYQQVTEKMVIEKNRAMMELVLTKQHIIQDRL
jgi:hypothetical protein